MISSMTERRYDALVDARGLSCPMPLVKARQALMVLEGGATVCVLATDPAAPGDFEEFAEATGHALLDSLERDGIFVVVIEKRR
jgi:tRNA 2-thiouridine synthesizing protein A